MDPEKYINKFNILSEKTLKNKIMNKNICPGIDPYEWLAQTLYSNILNRYMLEISKSEYEYFREYQERFYDLIENMRTLNETEIIEIFQYLYPINPCLIDIIIMMWCLPRVGNYFSHTKYNKVYAENITNFNKKIINNIDTVFVKNFCIETISKNNYVPVHCLDYIWQYITEIEMEVDFDFYNKINSGYIGITLPSNDAKHIIIGINIEHVLAIGLGKIRSGNKNNSFSDFIKYLLSNEELLNKYKQYRSGNNLIHQANMILSNPTKYFDDYKN